MESSIPKQEIRQIGNGSCTDYGGITSSSFLCGFLDRTQDHHCLFFAKLFQVSAPEAQGHAIEQVHDQADHYRMTLETQFDEVGDADWVGDSLTNGTKLTIPDLNADLGVGTDILEPIGV